MSESQLTQRFSQVCRSYAARACVYDDTGVTSFEEIWLAANRLALHLCPGERGRRVALLVPPSADWVKGFWGVLLAGGLVVPLVEMQPTAELARSLRAGNVSLVLVARRLRSRAQEAALAAGPAEGASAPPVVLELEALLESEPKLAQSAPLLEGTRAGVLFFTSGTTGTPKGVLLSHDQLAALARLVGSAWRVTASDRLVHCLPLHHTHGLGIAFLVCMLAGASQHFLQRFEAQAVWRAFDESTLFMGVPTMHKRLLDAYAAEPAEVQARWRAAAKRQRLITSGSSALPESLALGWAELCGSLPLERYGMTEVGVALSNPFEGERRAGSPGPVLPGMQVRLVDASGRDVAKDEPGEIWIRGPSVFSGYDADEAATSSSFCEGWFKSGDTAIWLDDGYVKILGRTSIDIIKSGGYKLSALEIEEATRRCAGVEDVAVVGVPDAEFGEIAVAVIVLKGQLEAETITRFLKAELAPYKVPRRIVFTSALPHNALGKVTKHLLRERIANQLC